MSLRISICLLICWLFADQSFAANPELRYRFPDNLETGELLLRVQYSKIKDAMEAASFEQRSLTQAEQDVLRKGLEQLAASGPEEPVTVFAQRRLIILDWQSGKLSDVEAADRMWEFAKQLEGAERYRSEAMALSIEVKARQVKRFRKGYASLPYAKVPEFGSFVFVYARELLDGYLGESASQEDLLKGQPIPKVYQRKMELADFLEKEFLPSLGTFLKEYQDRLDQAEPDSPDLNSDTAKTERANIALAMKYLNRYINEGLSGRIYLDISERTSDVLLPRSLELWESSIELIDRDGKNGLESPEVHRKEIDTYRKSIVPRLKQLQENKHLLREYGQVIIQQENKLENLDRETLERMAAEQKAASETAPAPADSWSTTTARNLVVILNVAVICALVVVAYVKRKRKLAATREGSSE